MSNSQVKPKSLLRQCITLVSKYVECHDPLEFFLLDDLKGVYALRNTTKPMAMDGAPSFFLLRVKKSKGLYMHFSITLKPPKRGASIEIKHEFEGISVQFLQGTGRLFCRAEWDIKKKKDRLEHPQPHWHWGKDKEDNMTSWFDAIGEMDVQEGCFNVKMEEKSDLPQIDFEELHYAMTAKWVTKDTAVEDFTVQSLQTWLKNCIENIIDQYNYQVNKGNFESSKNW